MLFTVAVALSLVEMLFPLPGYGVKLGLSNIVIMYSLIAVDRRTAISIGILKSIFVVITRGPVAGLLSFSGFLLCILVMLFLMAISRKDISYLLLSVLSALAHNLGQLIVVALLYSPLLAYANIPILGISSVVTGAVTATLLRLTMPVLNKIK